MGDDRITCAVCSRYDSDGYRCLAARPPMGCVPDLPRRCEYFNARDGAMDKRKGVERWPSLVDAPGGPARKVFVVCARP